MAEQILRLAPALRFEACEDGRCRIVRRTGDAYTFTNSQRALFERLWRGLSDADMHSVSQGQGALGGWLLSMRELGIVETAPTRRDSDIVWVTAAAADASFTPWPHACLALWGLVLTTLCVDAILRNAFDHSMPPLSFIHLVAIAAAWCTWVVLHEVAHFLVARWHGVSGRMEFFRQGIFAPRFYAQAVAELASARVRYSIYIAGPLLDCTIALVFLVAAKIQSNLWFDWASITASVFCAFSLLPLNDCDARKAWDCVARGRAQPRCKYCAFFLVYSVIACLCLATTSVLCIEMLFRIAPVHGGYSTSH